MIESIFTIFSIITVPVVIFLVLKYENNHQADNFKPLY